MPLSAQKAELLAAGTVIPAHPLALTQRHTLDERRQCALTRYYAESGGGGIAVAVHTTQFEIRDPKIGLFEPVLQLAAATLDEQASYRHLLRIAGVAGDTGQAVREASIARDLGYDAVLVSPGGLSHWSEDELLNRSAVIGEVLPVIGFYLQEAVGGRYLSKDYWRRLADQPSTVAVKAAPFDRYRTVELVQGVALAERGNHVALYTGNDDNIVSDLLTPFIVRGTQGMIERRFVGGLLGHWAVWTRSAVKLLELTKRAYQGDISAMTAALRLSVMVTDANSAIFDSRNNFAGVIAGVHEVLRRQGLLEGIWCLDPNQTLSPCQADLINEAILNSSASTSEQQFIDSNIERWLR